MMQPTILRERVVESTRLEICRHVFDEAGDGEWSFDGGMLELNLSGRSVAGEVYFEGQSGDVGGMVGELAYFPSRTPFKGRWESGTETNFCCYFPSGVSSHLRALSDEQLGQSVSIKSPHLVRSMQMMRQEVELGDAHSNDILDGLCRQISGLLARHLETLRAAPNVGREQRAILVPFQTILQELDGYRGMPTLQALADRWSYSEQHFGRLFQRATGHRFSDLVVRRKMIRAEELLRSTRMAVKEIAFEVGYDVAADFSRAFKHHVGLSPAEFRTRHQAPERLDMGLPERSMLPVRRRRQRR